MKRFLSIVTKSALVCILVAMAGFGPVPTTVACPLCSAPSLTLSEQLAKADVVILAQWVSGETPEKEKLGSTSYEIVNAARTPVKSVEKGKKITLDRYRAGKKGSLSLLLGTRTKGETIEWSSPLDVTEKSYAYIVEAPSLESKPVTRLGYYLKFLEDPDPLIANDAYGEFASAPYKDVAPLADRFPRDLLRQWVVSPDIPPTRLGLYGLMLGLCGNEDDAALMQAKITEKNDDFRLGIEGVIGGYLLLTGEKGLDAIENSKLKDKEAAFSETYAAMQALRFLWTYGNGRIPADRLRSSMRLLLERPEVSDLVIADLARWKDWSVQARLMELYGAEGYSIPSIKRAIIRYMISSTKDVPAGGGEKPPKHAVEGGRCLEQLRDKDAKMVNEVERYFFLQ
ncbi:MAG TPA: hypothetical protein VKU82_05280 [Planctomycetaceae bacterium]|nr:hypothetical protein [Planctomycetaceae bacterium]